MALLVTTEVVKWASVMIIRGLAEDKPNELVSISVIRARFCELIMISLGLENLLRNW